MMVKKNRGIVPVNQSALTTTKDPLDLYLQALAKYPILSKEEESRLSKKLWTTKDPNIAKILAQANLRFVVKIAMEYTRFGARLIDLIQEGNIGLLQAIRQFNPYKNVRLITYAVWWIRGYIQEYLMRQHSLVRIGTTAKQRKLFYLLRKQQEQLRQLPNLNDKEKFLTYSNFQEKELQTMQQRLIAKDISLDHPVSSDTSTRLIDLQQNKEELSQEEALNLFQERNIIKQVLAKLRTTLNDKELFILDNRLLAHSPLTLQKIGQKYSVTREYIRQIESQLIQKIKVLVQKKLQTKKIL